MTNSKSIERCTLLSFIMLRAEKHSFFFKAHKKKEKIVRYINFNPTHIKTVTEIKKISSYISLEVLDMIFSHNIVIFPIFNGDLSCFKWDFCDNFFCFFKFYCIYFD